MLHENAMCLLAIAQLRKPYIGWVGSRSKIKLTGQRQVYFLNKKNPGWSLIHTESVKGNTHLHISVLDPWPKVQKYYCMFGLLSLLIPKMESPPVSGLPESSLCLPHHFWGSHSMALNFKRDAYWIEGPLRSVRRRNLHTCLDSLIGSADIYPEAGSLGLLRHQLCPGCGQRGPGLLWLCGHPHQQCQHEGEGACP